MAVHEAYRPGEQPSAQQVIDARLAAGISQAEAAASVYLGARSRWTEYETGARNMDAARYELFLFKHGLHPGLKTARAD